MKKNGELYCICCTAKTAEVDILGPTLWQVVWE